MDAKEIIKRLVMIATVAGITVLLLNPAWLAIGGFVVIKWLFILLLAGIVARVVFKKSIKEIIFGDDED